MSRFDDACKELFDVEGGFSDHKSDRGGPTNYGVTELVARANGYSGRMQDLSPYAAKQIAKTQFWDTLRGDEIAALSYPVMREVFDTAYNCGTATAAKMLQRALNALNRQGRDYHDVKVDGLVGPLTVHALRLFLLKRSQDGQAVLLKVLNALQGERYITLAEKDPTQEEFVYGWIRNRVEI